MPTPTVGADSYGVESEWTYHDKHLTGLTDKNFLSAARCIVYARPTNVGGDNGKDYIFHKMGVIQGYNWAEQKNIEMIFELGSDIPYLIPGRTTGQISISRILIAGADMLNLFYADDSHVIDGETKPNDWLRSLRDVTIPLDLLVVYYDQRSNATYSRLFSTCWIQSRQESLNAGQIIVAESVNIMYQNVIQYDTTAGTSIFTP